jgi:hypothetical protein
MHRKSQKIILETIEMWNYFWIKSSHEKVFHIVKVAVHDTLNLGGGDIP